MSGQVVLPHFDRFTALPAELRLKIWELHFQQRRLIVLQCAGGWWHMPHHSLPAEIYAETLDPDTGQPIDVKWLLSVRLVCSEANQCFASRHEVAGLAFAQNPDASLLPSSRQSRVAFRLDSNPTTPTPTPTQPETSSESSGGGEPIRLRRRRTFAVDWGADMIYIAASMYPTWFLEHCPWRGRVQRIAFLLHDEGERRLGPNYWLGRQPEHDATAGRLRSLAAVHASTFAQLPGLRAAWLVVAADVPKGDIAGGARDPWGFVPPGSEEAGARFPLCLVGHPGADGDPYLTRAERVVRMIRGGAEGLERDICIRCGFDGV